MAEAPGSNPGRSTERAIRAWEGTEVTKLEQNLINHVALVLDGSGSMRSHETNVIKVVDGLIEWLAKRSQDHDQETRVTVYVFDYSNNINCVIFDKDVLRLPSIAKLYRIGGQTALIDATIRSQEDLAQTFTKYGDHAFLTFVITDGYENASHFSASTLRSLLSKQGDNWTLAALVPSMRSKIDAESFGFPKGNIEVWDTNSFTGMAEVGEKIREATDSFYTSRTSGIRSSTTLFAQNVTQAQVDASGMKPVDPSQFVIVPVVATGDMQYVIPKKSVTKRNPDGIKHVEIMPFVQATGRTYVAGTAYYELVKSERYEYHKGVALIHRQTKKVYTGDEAKALIGLTGTSTRVRPQAVKGGEYDIFIQSQSINRYLPIGSRVLLFK